MSNESITSFRSDGGGGGWHRFKLPTNYNNRTSNLYANTPCVDIHK